MDYGLGLPHAGGDGFGGGVSGWCYGEGGEGG